MLPETSNYKINIKSYLNKYTQTDVQLTIPENILIWIICNGWKRFQNRLRLVQKCNSISVFLSALTVKLSLVCKTIYVENDSTVGVKEELIAHKWIIDFVLATHTVLYQIVYLHYVIRPSTITCYCIYMTGLAVTTCCITSTSLVIKLHSILAC